MDRINIQPLSGFRDFGQKEQVNRLWLIDLALNVYRQFGYEPIDTPAIEREEILGGNYGAEADVLRYRFPYGGEELGLRYDLTVPFSRFVTVNLRSGAISMPFRRSQVGMAWRGEKPQKGRKREFTQADFDIAGSSEPFADAEKRPF